jgi:hypothetical protein
MLCHRIHKQAGFLIGRSVLFTISQVTMPDSGYPTSYSGVTNTVTAKLLSTRSLALTHHAACDPVRVN